MKWKDGRPTVRTMAGLALLAFAVYGLAESTKRPSPQRWFDEKLRAAQTAAMAQFVIRQRSAELGIHLDPTNDPNGTSLIGEQFTEITTDRGLLNAKLTVTNPNFAAAVVEMLKRAKLEPGDEVALGLTGSMPGLNIAALSACEALELRPLVITSIGASMWGANRPELTWLDMETALNGAGVLHCRSIAASLGGGADHGRGLSPNGRKLLREAIHRNGVELIEEDDLESSIQRRMELYDRNTTGRIKAYINVGGGLASLGGTQNARLVPPGLSKNLGIRNYPVRGVLNRMAERDLPVINLLEVDRLAERYELPETPVPLPTAGEGPLFLRERYPVAPVIGCAVFLALAVFAFIRVDVAHYLAGRRTPVRMYRPPQVPR